MQVNTAFLFIFVQVYLCSSERISLKLFGGSSSREGNVLVKRGSDWGLVCDDEWDLNDGNVVCRQLGYRRAVKVTNYNFFHSTLAERIFLDDVKCQGHEANLGDCMHKEWLMSNCNAGEAAGVVCDDSAPVQPSGRAILKIVASTGQRLPTIDRQQPAASVRQQSVIGQLPDQIRNNEDTVRQPAQIDIETVKQPAQIDIESVAQPAQIDIETVKQPAQIDIETARKPAQAVIETVTRPAQMNIKLVNKPAETVSETASDSTQTVSETASDSTQTVSETASDTNSHRGYSQRTRELLARVHDLLNNPVQAPVQAPAVQPQRVDTPSLYQSVPSLDGMDSSVGTSVDTRPALSISLTHDGLSAPGSNTRSVDAHVGVGPAAALQGRSGSFVATAASDAATPLQPGTVSAAEIKKVDQAIKEMKLKSDQPLSPPARPYRVEVVGGRRSNEGYVKVMLDNGQSGVVCSDHWGIYEAMVVCRQAGKQQAEKATLIDYYGARTQDKVLYEVHCDGHEKTLADCEYRLTDRHGAKCSKPMNVAGVVCTSAKLPDLMPNLWALQNSVRMEEKPLHSLTCAMEEKCLSSSAHTASASTNSFSYTGMFGGFSSGPTRRLLRFNSNIFNNGTADFRPKQHRSGWQWHSCHQHYHSMGAFSHYDVLDSHGNRVAEGHKASFCLEDVECKWPHRQKYSCRGFGDQGISVGCADVYKSDIDCQWIDVTDLKAGAYVFKLNVNPDLEVPELSYDNNAAVCELTYNGYGAKLSNCVLARG